MDDIGLYSLQYTLQTKYMLNSICSFNLKMDISVINQDIVKNYLCALLLDCKLNWVQSL